MRLDDFIPAMEASRRFPIPALKGGAIIKCPFKGAKGNSPPFQRRVDR